MLAAQIAKRPKPMSREWGAAFLQRHPQLNIKEENQTTAARRAASTPHIILKFLIRQKQLMRTKGIKIVINIDESSLSTNKKKWVDRFFDRVIRHNDAQFLDGVKQLIATEVHVSIVAMIDSTGYIYNCWVVAASAAEELKSIARDSKANINGEMDNDDDKSAYQMEIERVLPVGWILEFSENGSVDQRIFGKYLRWAAEQLKARYPGRLNRIMMTMDWLDTHHVVGGKHRSILNSFFDLSSSHDFRS